MIYKPCKKPVEFIYLLISNKIPTSEREEETRERGRRDKMKIETSTRSKAIKTSFSNVRMLSHAGSDHEYAPARSTILCSKVGSNEVKLPTVEEADNMYYVCSYMLDEYRDEMWALWRARGMTAEEEEHHLMLRAWTRNADCHFTSTLPTAIIMAEELLIDISIQTFERVAEMADMSACDFDA